MKPKIYAFLLLLVMLIAAVWLVKRNKDKPATGTSRNSGPSPDPINTPAATAGGVGLNRKISNLEYTLHAKCRMKCRHITRAEIKDILKNGSINYNKSDLNDKPCPSYALEGYTHQDNQHVRIVFAQCGRKTKVVTCIDLDHDFTCGCK